MKKGFTLVELLVALALFGFVVIIVAGVLTTVSESNLSAQISRKTIDNVDFILDDIIREARLGKNYHCSISAINDYNDDKNPVDCYNGMNSFALTQVGTNNLIRYSTTTYNGLSVIKKEVIEGGTNTVLSSTQLSASEISISSLKFYVSGSQKGDSLAAQVLVTLQAELAQGNKDPVKVNLQTTIVQRDTDT